MKSAVTANSHLPLVSAVIINGIKLPLNNIVLMHQSVPPAPSPPSPLGLLRGICPPCQSRGWGICKFFTARGPRAFANAGAIPELSNTHAVSHQNKTTQRVLLEKKQIGLSVKDRNKLKRVVRACSRFYACISSLLFKPKLHSETGAIDVNQRYQYQYQYYLKNILS